MFNRLVVVVVFLTLAVSAIASDINTKLLIHGTSGDGPVTLNGWLIGTNLGSGPHKWLLSAGPRFNGEKGWLEFNAGALIVSNTIVFVPEFRGSYTAKPYSFFTNLEWINPGNSTQGVYLFLQGSRAVGRRIRIGLETEDTWKHGATVLTVGPQIVFVLGRKASIVSSYQFTNGKEDHAWARLVFSF
ncbi:MAG TPA: hypothetical protein VJH06_02635 [Candidatus Paceibacterota bacterium]